MGRMDNPASWARGIPTIDLTVSRIDTEFSTMLSRQPARALTCDRAGWLASKAAIFVRAVKNGNMASAEVETLEWTRSIFIPSRWGTVRHG